MDKIWVVVTCRTLDTKNEKFRDSRNVGWYNDLQEADKVLLNNYGDVYEDGYYPYAIIEQVPQGLYPICETALFYRWDKDKKRYIQIEKPEELKHIINYSIG